MESSRDDRLTATLSALRPAPRPEFAAELDERAAAGFPRRSPGGASPFARLLARLRAMPPRRALLSAGATALATVAVATVIVASSGSDSGSSATVGATGGVGIAAGVESSSAGEAESGEALDDRLPRSAQKAAAGSAAVSPSESSPEAESTGGEYLAEIPTVVKPDKTGPYASRTNHRDVERAAAMILGAEPGEVGEDSAKVFEAVHAANGIVLDSSTTGGTAGDAGARFDLLIPSAKLGDALAAFSGIAEVVSRHETTNDVTAPTIGLSERLQDSNAKIDGLLNQLAGSETEAERDAVEAELRAERNRTARLRSSLSGIQRRTSFSRVSLRIETGGSPSGSGGGGWDVGDALHDAGHILAISAGVAIVGLAILGPLALICLLLWLANRARVRRGRERALD